MRMKNKLTDNIVASYILLVLLMEPITYFFSRIMPNDLAFYIINLEKLSKYILLIIIVLIAIGIFARNIYKYTLIIYTMFIVGIIFAAISLYRGMEVYSLLAVFKNNFMIYMVFILAVSCNVNTYYKISNWFFIYAAINSIVILYQMIGMYYGFLTPLQIYSHFSIVGLDITNSMYQYSGIYRVPGICNTSQTAGLISGIGFLIGLFKIDSGIKQNNYIFFLTIINLLGLIASTSKSAYICIALVLIFAFFIKIPSLKIRLTQRKLLLFFVSSLSFLFIIIYFKDRFIEMLLILGSDSYQTDTWFFIQNSMVSIRESYFLGHGFAVEKNIEANIAYLSEINLTTRGTAEIYGIPVTSEISWLYTFAQFGIAYMILTLLLFVSYFRKISRLLRYKNELAWISFSIFVCGVFFNFHQRIIGEGNYFPWFIFFLAYPFALYRAKLKASSPSSISFT